MKLLCVLALALALPLNAATETATVTVPDAQAAQLATIIESWIQGQKLSDGSLKYPGATVGDRRGALMNAILRDGLRRVIRQACSQFPADCPTPIKARIADKATAELSIETEVVTLVQ